MAAFANHLGGTLLIGANEVDGLLDAYVGLEEIDAALVRDSYSRAVADLANRTCQAAARALLPWWTMANEKTRQNKGEDDGSPHGSEKEADAQRPGGPRYHGAGWERADDEEQGGEQVRNAPRADDPERVDPGRVPGAKGKPGGAGSRS
ncbi:MAG TPA: hypothetical protein VNO33_14435 [Kofleriaceae bacterium]|nr:hypothetical protein [Kofleriaceae bacterium]